MKKLLLLPFIALFLVSCSDDDNVVMATPDVPQSTMWKIHEITYNDVPGVNAPCSSDDTMDLRTDGTGTLQNYYQADGNICTASTPVNFEYQIINDIFVISYTQNGNPYNYQEMILEHTATTFTIDVSHRFAGPDNNMQVIATYKKV